MVKWRTAAYIGIVVFPTFVLAPGCGEPADPPPGVPDEVEEVTVEFDDDAPADTPSEPSDSSDSSEPGGDAAAGESGE